MSSKKKKSEMDKLYPLRNEEAQLVQQETIAETV
jgi:hypothetical protein